MPQFTPAPGPASSIGLPLKIDCLLATSELSFDRCVSKFFIFFYISSFYLPASFFLAELKHLLLGLAISVSCVDDKLPPLLHIAVRVSCALANGLTFLLSCVLIPCIDLFLLTSVDFIISSLIDGFACTSIILGLACDLTLMLLSFPLGRNDTSPAVSMAKKLLSSSISLSFVKLLISGLKQ